MNYKKTLLFVAAWLLCLPLSVSYAQNTTPDDTRNQAELTLSDETKRYYNTDEVKSIDIDGTRTLSDPVYFTVYDSANR